MLELTFDPNLFPIFGSKFLVPNFRFLIFGSQFFFFFKSLILTKPDDSFFLLQIFSNLYFEKHGRTDKTFYKKT
jgi:hypothetical protein